jgi:hypothetical protein
MRAMGPSDQCKTSLLLFKKFDHRAFTCTRPTLDAADEISLCKVMSCADGINSSAQSSSLSR